MTIDPPEIIRAKSRFNAATACAAAGRHEEAVAAYLDVLEVVPDLAAGLFNLGNAYFALQRYAEAADAFRRASDIDADAATYNNLGNALASQGEIEQAVNAFRRALRLDTNFRPAINNIGPALFQLGLPDEAFQYLVTAVNLSPNNPLAHAHLGDYFHQQGQLENAIGSYEQSLKLNPEQSETWINLGACQTELGRLSDAAASYVRAQQIHPHDPRVYSNLGELNRRRGRVTEAGFCYLRALQLAPHLHQTHSNCLLTMLYDPDVSPERLFDESKNWARQHTSHLTRLPPPPNDATRSRRLRIGYLSGDLRKHPVGHFLEPVLRSHDAASVEVYCYANQRHSDEVTERLRENVDHWRFVYQDSDDELAASIRADKIDILVELSGHTADNRLCVLARRPAPVQASWIGYSGPTGLAEIDYLLADDTVVPSPEQAFYTEKVMRLPDSYVCFSGPQDSPVVASLPAASANHVTFGCCNNLAKISPVVVRCWSSVLLAVPRSQLFVKTPALADAGVCDRIRASFGENLVGADRLRFAPGGTRQDMLAAYAEIDIALDPFPFNGGLTTLEALWMGVPVLTLRGERFAGHATASFLKAIGLDNWIANSREEYTAKAVAAASDLEALAELRYTLRDRMTASPLCDARQFTRQLETAYRQMWHRWCDRFTSNLAASGSTGGTSSKESSNGSDNA